MPGFPPAQPVSLAAVYQARQRIAGKVLRTPLIASPGLSDRVGGSVYLKLEGLQKTGSFKIRGAFNKILTLSREENRRGVITFSTGNHGRAVACAAGEAGIPAVVCVSEHVPSYRVQAIASYGAQVVVRGKGGLAASSQDTGYTSGFVAETLASGAPASPLSITNCIKRVLSD